MGLISDRDYFLGDTINPSRFPYAEFDVSQSNQNHWGVVDADMYRGTDLRI
jgi:hypothetical protein